MKHARLAIGSVAFISGLSAAAAGLVAAVSLTRIAGDKLGFPDHLEWTLTAAVDIGAIGGAILWSISPVKSPNRRTGMWLNIACSTMSATGVGLDHAANAHPDAPWGTVAFIVGAFLPLLSTWLIHGLAKLADGQRPVAPPVPQAQPVTITATAEAAGATPSAVERPAPAAPVRLVKAKPPRPALVPPLPAAEGDGPDPYDWAVTNWPTDHQAVQAATGCSRSTAFRALRKAREEVETREEVLASGG